jgi:hypothetical protein
MLVTVERKVSAGVPLPAVFKLALPVKDGCPVTVSEKLPKICVDRGIVICKSGSRYGVSCLRVWLSCVLLTRAVLCSID